MSLSPQREAQLRGHMPEDMWQAFYARCQTWGVPINDDSLEFGSVFLECKAWFELGWLSCAANEEKK